MMNAISIALTGLQAATRKLNATASNVANVQSVGSLEAGKQAPYAPLGMVQSTVDINGEGKGVQSKYTGRTPAFIPSYDPDSPFADEKGIIGVPNIDLAEEAGNLKLSELTYKANIGVLKTAEEMSDELLNIFDDEV